MKFSQMNLHLVSLHGTVFQIHGSNTLLQMPQNLHNQEKKRHAGSFMYWLCLYVFWLESAKERTYTSSCAIHKHFAVFWNQKITQVFAVFFTACLPEKMIIWYSIWYSTFPRLSSTTTNSANLQKNTVEYNRTKPIERLQSWSRVGSKMASASIKNSESEKRHERAQRRWVDLFQSKAVKGDCMDNFFLHAQTYMWDDDCCRVQNCFRKVPLIS